MAKSEKPTPAPLNDLQCQIDKFVFHLREVEAAFNGACDEHGLGIHISADALIKSVDQDGIRISRAVNYASGADDSGILHTEQIVTAVAAIAEIIAKNEQVLVHGPMQSGKTTTSLAMQLAAPLYYMITGEPMYPFYFLTSHSSQQEQTLYELQRFVDFYSELRFVRVAGKPTAPKKIDQVFARASTLENYRNSVLKEGLKEGVYREQMGPEDYVTTRAMGKKIKGVAQRLKQIMSAGYVTCLIIDEPQFGVMDRIVIDKDTGDVRKVESVFKRMFREIEKVTEVPKGGHTFVALSATPYELFDIEGIKVVQQKIGAGYQGFNFFAGEKIDPQANPNQPIIQSLSQAAKIYEEPFLEKINLAALNKVSRFGKLRDKLNVPLSMSHKKYRDSCVSALRGLMRKIAQKHPDGKFGVCIRSRNNNDFARDFGKELKLDDVYEVMHYSGKDVTNTSVKRLLAARKDPHKPYLLFVTNRARMGDAFPRSAMYFIELTERFTDMNSMFQGFIGRACGYGKNSTVILSDANATMINNVVDWQGRYGYTASRGSLVVNKQRRGRPSSLVVIDRSSDPVVERFFKEIDDDFRHKRFFTTVYPTLPARRNRNNNNPGLSFAPLFRYDSKTGFLDYVEANRAKLLPEYPAFHIVREGEHIEVSGRAKGKLEYNRDFNGGCEVITRETGADLKQSGVRGRGDSTNLIPQIAFQKFDKDSGKPLVDTKRKRLTGEWKACAIVLPLIKPVTPTISADATLPRPEALFSDNLNKEERKIQKIALTGARNVRRRGA